MCLCYTRAIKSNACLALYTMFGSTTLNGRKMDTKQAKLACTTKPKSMVVLAQKCFIASPCSHQDSTFVSKSYKQLRRVSLQRTQVCFTSQVSLQAFLSLSKSMQWCQNLIILHSTLSKVWFDLDWFLHSYEV